jgi:hypothetical protein
MQNCAAGSVFYRCFSGDLTENFSFEKAVKACDQLTKATAILGTSLICFSVDEPLLGITSQLTEVAPGPLYSSPVKRPLLATEPELSKNTEATPKRLRQI